MQSSQWIGKVSPRPKNHGWVGQRSRWHWLCFSIGKALSIMRFAPRALMVNRQFYQEILALLRDALGRTRPELWKKQTSMLHHDIAQLTRRSSSTVIWQNIRYPLCPIHSNIRTYPSEFFLFPNFETFLKKSRNQTIEEIRNCDKSTPRHQRMWVPGRIPKMEQKLWKLYRQ